MKQWLIAHTNSNGTGIAQATVQHKTEMQARVKFEELHPERLITVSGQKALASEVIKR